MGSAQWAGRRENALAESAAGELRERFSLALGNFLVVLCVL
jgi:hypothetical protein